MPYAVILLAENPAEEAVGRFVSSLRDPARRLVEAVGIESLSNTLKSAVEGGAEEIVVLPLFLQLPKALDRALASALETARFTHPEARVTLAPAIGFGPGILDLLAGRLEQAISSLEGQAGAADSRGRGSHGYPHRLQLSRLSADARSDSGRQPVEIRTTRQRDPGRNAARSRQRQAGRDARGLLRTRRRFFGQGTFGATPGTGIDDLPARRTTAAGPGRWAAASPDPRRGRPLREHQGRFPPRDQVGTGSIREAPFGTKAGRWMTLGRRLSNLNHSRER